MQLICESTNYDDYLTELEEINYGHPLIQQAIHQLQTSNPETEFERIQITYQFVRDQISHSCDIPDSSKVTCIASDVLEYREGLCFAKSHLLASLLRAQNIPTSFCYQRLQDDTAPKGYFIHGLNAVYLRSLNRWRRLDARGNKPGCQAEFNIDEEKLAYFTRSERGEIDYPTLYSRPHAKVLQLLKAHNSSLKECLTHIPDKL